MDYKVINYIGCNAIKSRDAKADPTERQQWSLWSPPAGSSECVTTVHTQQLGGVGPSLVEEVQFLPLQNLLCGLVTGFTVKIVTYVFYGSREKFTKKIFLYETSNVQAILVLLPYLDR